MIWLTIVIKSFGSLVALFLLTKLMGKKQISQLNLYDYIVGITIGSVAAEASINDYNTFFKGIIVMTVYTLVSVLIAYLTNKNINIRRVFTGVPIILIENGKIIEKNLSKVRLDINDMLQQARTNNCFDISEVEYAVMEPNGQISFLLKSKYLPLTPNDMKIKTNYKGLTANLIIDGIILENNLKYMNKDMKWLLTRLENNKVKVKNILLLTCDSNEQLSIYIKGEPLKNSKVLE